MKKRNIIITAVIILIIALIFAVTSCVPNRSTEEETITSVDTIPTETQFAGTEPTMQETVAPTEAVTELLETVPNVATAPAVNTSSYTNSNSSGTENSTPNTPSATDPPEAMPTQTAPAEPTPTEHIHSWQEICHAEESHDVWWIVCQCGSKFATIDEMNAHSNTFLGSEEWLNHAGYSELHETITDTPAYSTWVCACGATSDTQPRYAKEPD